MRKASITLATFAAAAAVAAIWKSSTGDAHLATKTDTADVPQVTAQPRGRNQRVAPEPSRDDGYGELRGVARDRDGKPVGGASVCAWCSNCNIGFTANRPYCGKSGAAGDFVLPEIAPGKYRITGAAPGHGMGVGNGGAVVEVVGHGSVGDRSDVSLSEEEALVSGLVRDALGGPIPFAEVRVASQSAKGAVGESAGVGVTADADGRFQVGVPRGWVRVVGFADGYAPADVTHSAPAQGVELVLVPAAAIHGRVVIAGSMKPIGNVRVQALDRGRHGQVAVSEPDGSFHLEGLRPGTYQLRANGEAKLGMYESSVSVALADRVDDVVISLGPATLVEGVIMVDGEPCPKGAVQVLPVGSESQPPALPGMATGDAEGRVVFETLRPGAYQVVLQCPGYREQTGELLQVGHEPRHNVVWRMAGGAQLNVVVANEDGGPAAGLLMTLRRVDTLSTAGGLDDSQPRMGMTDATGRLRLNGLDAGDYVLSYRVGGEEQPVDEHVTVRAHQLQQVEVSLSSAAELVVRVVGENGEPPRRKLTVVAGQAGRPPAAFGVALGGGVFRIAPVAEGSYRVTVWDDVNPAITHSEVVALEPGQKSELTIPYGGHSSSISGRVVNDEGLGVADVVVQVAPAGRQLGSASMSTLALALAGDFALTDAQGRFTIDGLDPHGVYNLRAEHGSGAGTAQVNGVEADQQHLEVPIDEPGRLAGRVINADGSPVQDFILSVRNKEAAKHGPTRRFSGQDGAWSFPYVAPGTLELLAHDRAGRKAVLGASLRPGADLDGIELAMHPD